MTAPQLFSTAHVAADLGLSVRRVQQLAKSRSVGQNVDGQFLVFTEADIEAMRVRVNGRPRKPVG